MQFDFSVRAKSTAQILASTLALLALVCLTPEACRCEDWEVNYDGVGSAADNVPNYLRWDSAIDDDWDEPPSTFQLDSPSVGFMSVDRVTNAADHIKTGNIWTRDPILNYAAGFTMEVGVKLLPNSNPNAFSMTYLDNGTSFGVHLSPNQIKAGNLAAGGAGATTAFNTVNAFHNYRIVKLPNSQTIRVYVDGNTTPIITGSGDTTYVTGTQYLRYPRVLIGDNENNTAYNANYVLDYVRYRRGATAPGETPQVFPARVLPPMPPPAPAPTPGVVPVWQSTFDSAADSVVNIFNGNSGKAMIGSASNGRLQITSWDNTTDAYSPDKAGRPLGMTLDGNDSMSAQYKFNWSTLESSSTMAYEAVGFLGESTAPQTRQILGSVMRHWKSGSDYMVAVDVAAGSIGVAGFGYLAGTAINLGPNALTNDYDFRIGYDGSTHKLGLDLYNNIGSRIGGQLVDLDTDVPGLLSSGNAAQEINSFALTHLGWSDYSGNLGNRATVWQANSLTFDDTPTGAFNTGARTAESWTTGYDGVGQPISSGWIQGGGSVFLQQPGGIMEYNGLSGVGNARMDNIPTWSDQAGITIEARIKVMPDSQEQGFNLVANDSLGATLVLSSDKVQLMHSYMAVGAATVAMDTTDDFHLYRLVRNAGDLYWHLYIDDNPIAAIAYQHAAGDQIPFSRIWFGDVNFPVPENGAHVLIDYVRWHQGANAPLLIGDYDGDSDVDADDFVVWRSQYGTAGPSADANRDGIVDSADYIIWRKHLGQSIPTGAGTIANTAEVPEPNAGVLVVIAFGMISSMLAIRPQRNVTTKLS